MARIAAGRCHITVITSYSIHYTKLYDAAGLLWLLDSLVFLPKRRERLRQAQAQAGGALPEEQAKVLMRPAEWADLSRSMFPVLAIVLLLRSFLFERNNFV